MSTSIDKLNDIHATTIVIGEYSFVPSGIIYECHGPAEGEDTYRGEVQHYVHSGTLYYEDDAVSNLKDLVASFGDEYFV